MRTNAQVYQSSANKFNGKESNTASENEHNRLRKREWFGLLLAFFSVLGVTLTLVGYGVALSVNEVFNIPHETLFTSPFDLLELSDWAVQRIFERIANFASPFELYKHGVAQFLLPTGMAFFFWSIGIFVVKYKSEIIAVRRLSPKWLADFFKRPRISDSKIMLILKGCIYCLMFLFSAPFFMIFGLAVIFFVLSAFEIAAIIGIGAGNTYIQQYVIAPKACAPLFNRADRLRIDPAKKAHKVDYATCLVVSKDHEELGRGRAIFTTTGAVILFDPATGALRRIPIKDAIIDMVDSLESPALPRNSAPSNSQKRANQTGDKTQN